MMLASNHQIHKQERIYPNDFGIDALFTLTHNCVPFVRLHHAVDDVGLVDS